MQGNYPSLLGLGKPTLARNSFGCHTFKSVAKLGGIQRREINKVGGKKIGAEKKTQRHDF